MKGIKLFWKSLTHLIFHLSWNDFRNDVYCNPRLWIHNPDPVNLKFGIRIRFQWPKNNNPQHCRIDCKFWQFDIWSIPNLCLILSERVSRMKKMKIAPELVAKVTPDRIFSLAVHPTSHKEGNQVFLWADLRWSGIGPDAEDKYYIEACG